MAQTGIFPPKTDKGVDKSTNCSI